MPELPEVEIMARNLDRWTAGRVLTGVTVVDERVDSGGVVAWSAGAAGQTVGRSWRRAKYAVTEVGSRVLVLHFRMTGKVVAAEPGTRKAERLVLHLATQAGRPDAVVFDDARHLGNAWVRPREGLDTWFSQDRKLGPEPWPMRRTAAFWHHQLGHTRRPVKVALMHQESIAGIGNILASEVLWRARIDPKRPARDLTTADWERVADAVAGVVDDTLARDSGDEIAYVNSRGGSTRGVASPFSVYRCEGQPCPRCAAPVERFKQSGRSTFWCATCQGST